MQCPWDTVPAWPQASVGLQPVPLHPAELGDFKWLCYNFCLHPAPSPCQPCCLAPGCGGGWLRWSASARRCTWVLPCRHPRLSCGAVWVPCRRNIKPHGSVKTLPANHRAMQGSIPALLRAAEPAQLLQQVTCGWAVEPLYKHVLARACSLQGSFQLHFGAVSVVRYQLN